MSYGILTGALSRGRSTNYRAIATTFALIIALLTIAGFASTASAAFSATGWSTTPTSLQAGGHSTLNINATMDPVAGDLNGDDLSSLSIDLPAGQLVNPRAATTCPTANFSADTCLASSQVGTITFSFRAAGKINTASGSVYSLTPDATSLITFGFVIRPATGYQKFSFTSGKTTGLGAVRPAPDAEYGLSILIPSIPRTIKTTGGTNTSMTISNLSIALSPGSGAAPSKYFAVNPTRCTPANSRATFTSYAGVVSTRTFSYAPTGCDQLPFDPSVMVGVSYSHAGRSTGFNATAYMPDADQQFAVQPAHVKEFSVSFARGSAVSASVASATTLCTEAQLGADTCPAASKIGTVSFAIPFSTAALSGNAYLTSRSPAQFGYIVRGERGAVATLRGSIADVTSGLSGAGAVAKFETLPQAPWTSATFDITKPLVVNPQKSCPNATAWADFTSYSGHRSTLGAIYSQTACPPETTLLFGPTGLVRGKSLLYFFNSDQPDATFECQVDYGGFTPCVSGFRTPSLTDGPHVTSIRAVYDGIRDGSPLQLAVTVDSTPPVLTVASPAQGASFEPDTPLTASFTADPAATTTCKLDASPATTCSSPASYAGLAIGAHKLTVSSRDLAGNVTTVARDFTVAELPKLPVVNITAPTTGSTLRTNKLVPEFTATSTSGAAITSTVCKVYSIQWDPRNNRWIEGLFTDLPCSSGVYFASYETGKLHRLKVYATDALGNVGMSSADFTPGKRNPAAAEVINDVAAGRLTDRTPTFELRYSDALYPIASLECAIAKKGESPVYTACGSSTILPALSSFAVTEPLVNGDWAFYTRTTAEGLTGEAYRMSFSVVDWAATYEATTTTKQAGAHPDLDVHIVPSGQLRAVDLTLPKGLIGSLNSFPQCTDLIEAKCDIETKVGTVFIDFSIAGLAGLNPSGGDVYMTGPQSPGDAAGLVIRFYSPVSQFLDVIIPLRIQLLNNAQSMRVFSDTIPTTVGDEDDPEMFTQFWVNDFTMHVNGGQGSPQPLLTNPSSCVASQFTASFGDTEGNKTPPATIAHQATGCPSVPFAPQYSQSISDAAAGSFVGLTADISVPNGNSSLRRAKVVQPPSLKPNLPALGTDSDQCPPGSAKADGTFDPSACPASALVGSVSITSPLLPRAVEGTVRLISASPLPSFGVYVNDPEFGLKLGFVGLNSTPIDPTCDPDITGFCDAQITTQFSTLPDIPSSTIHLVVDGPDRTTASGGTLSGKLIKVANPDDRICYPNSSGLATFTPHSATAVVNRPIEVSITGCAGG